ncbi:MAG: methyltransferase domain-containing protein [Actinomycetota bacterium]|nr:methyltransferase domain-containing protein [Actinomycetota bacterium]
MQNKSVSLFLKEKELLDSLFKSARREKIPVIDKETGRFLEIICLLENPKNILEIGCGTGFSSYFLIKNLKSGNYTGIDLNKERVRRAEKFIRSRFESGSLKFLGGSAVEIIRGLKGKFDLVFIDGAKFEYPSYIKSLEGKLEEGALIIADNILYKDKVFEEEVSGHDSNSVIGIREYIKYITEDKRFKSRFFDIGDGISVTEFHEKSG